MNTVPVKVTASRAKIDRLFSLDSRVHSYKQISGNRRYGTYILDVEEGQEGKIKLR